MPAARPRLLLTLLDALGGDVGNRDFQKLLFLYTQECETEPSYQFVPFKYGGFSFTSYADRRRLTDDGLIAKDADTWRLTEAGRQEVTTKGNGRIAVDRFCRAHFDLRGKRLVAYTYKRHPYYAIRSEIVDSVLPNEADRARVEAARPEKRPAGMVTIGYEGKTLEGYLNQLLAEGVVLLCDVRRNPISRKYGFSKGTLLTACEGVGIRYEHLPELGIASEQRHDLKRQADFDALFASYERCDLPNQTAAVERIAGWIRDDGLRVALTCFEALPEQCHRHCVAEAVATLLGNSAIRHLGEVCRRNVFLSR